MSRYEDRKKFINDSAEYKQVFDRRGVKKIKHYSTATLKYPTALEISSLEMRSYVWGVGDRFYKIAYEAYGDAEMWWVIAWFNKVPTEADVKNGDVLQIPYPLDRTLRMLGM